MKIGIPNTENEFASVYEGVLTAGENHYWISQGQKAARLYATPLQERELEDNLEDVVSVVGKLGNGLNGESNVGNYEINVSGIAEFEGALPEEDAYVSTLGDTSMTSYDTYVEEFDGDLDDLEPVEDIVFP